MPQIKGDSGIVKEPRVLAGFSAANSGQTSPATSTGANLNASATTGSGSSRDPGC